MSTLGAMDLRIRQLEEQVTHLLPFKYRAEAAESKLAALPDKIVEAVRSQVDAALEGLSEQEQQDSSKRSEYADVICDSIRDAVENAVKEVTGE